MSKKSKRQVAKNSTRPAASVISNKPVEFTPDYSYVMKDLRRIGLLAGTFVAALVILSFFLN
jgi:hypothetical protein